jgi:hypothetical protein
MTPDDAADLVLQLQTRARVAHDLGQLLLDCRSQEGSTDHGMADEYLDRLTHQLHLLLRSTETLSAGDRTPLDSPPIALAV